MKNSLVRLLLLYGILLWAASACKKEYSFENGQVAAGELARDAGGSCQPISVAGNFVLERSLNDSNFLTVQVNITSPGAYTIRTDTVNGYYFSASGSFPDTGTFFVQLPGIGMPIAKGEDHFTVRYDSSECAATVTVLNDVPEPAVYLLQGDPGTCMNAALLGDFIEGIDLDTSNGVNVQVLVSTAGTYSISTNTVNGYSFAGSGLFTTTGSQWVRLAATGKPLTTGTDAFTVTAGSSACSIAVAVLLAVPVSNTDYFPLTASSFWVYDHNFFLSDSVKRVVDGTAMKNTLSYTTMNEKLPVDPASKLFFRKEGIDFYENCRVDKYMGAFQFADLVEGDILFLKNVLSTGDSWETQEWKAKASYGNEILTIKYLFVCENGDAVVNINGNVFVHVYKIKMYPQLKSEFAGWSSSNEIYEFYYAKGIGLIYTKKVSGDFVQNEEQVTRWTVQ